MTRAKVSLFHRATLSQLGDGETKTAFQSLKIISNEGLFIEENVHLNFLFAVPKFQMYGNLHTAGDEAVAGLSTHVCEVKSMKRGKR